MIRILSPLVFVSCKTDFVSLWVAVLSNKKGQSVVICLANDLDVNLGLDPIVLNKGCVHFIWGTRRRQLKMESYFRCRLRGTRYGAKTLIQDVKLSTPYAVSTRNTY